MSEIGALLKREVEGVTPSADGLGRTLHIVSRRRRSRRASAGTMAALAFGGTLLALWAALNGGSRNFIPLGSLTGRVAFVRAVGSRQDVFVMNANGSGVANLTRGIGQNDGPRWSPDGSQIAFGSDRIGTWSVYVMNADGSGLRLLAKNGLVDAWAPNGGEILFTRERNGNYSDPGGDYDLFVTDLAGKVSRVTDTAWAEGQAAYSPNGSKLAVAISKDGFGEIYVMNSDGTGLVRITANRIGDDFSPAWSPDGRDIAFVGYRGGNKDIYVVRADGTGLRRLTMGPANDLSPAWSPDGKHIVFASPRDGSQAIFVMNADGTDQTRLTSPAIDDGEPVWIASAGS
jgi:TolB protein